jgi:hypothetical protein
MRILGADGSIRNLWPELLPAHRRWIWLKALLITALINLLVTGGIAWLSVTGQHRIPLWSVPLFDKPSTVTDTVGTLFLLPLITCLLCTTAVWHDLATDRLPPLSGRNGFETFSAKLPPTRLLRALVLAALCTVVLAPVSVLVLVTIDFSGLTVAQFVLFKAVFAIVLGAVVTPVIAVLAMADGSRPTFAPARPVAVDRVQLRGVEPNARLQPPHRRTRKM